MAGHRSYKDREEQILKESESDINEVHDKKKDLWIALEQLGNDMDTLQAKTESVTMTVANHLSEETEKSRQVVLKRLRDEVENERKALKIVRANMTHYKDKFSGFDEQFKLGKPVIAMLRRIPPDHRERETKIKQLQSQVGKFKGIMRELQDEFDDLEKEYAQKSVRMDEIDQIIFCPVDDSDTSEAAGPDKGQSLAASPPTDSDAQAVDWSSNKNDPTPKKAENVDLSLPDVSEESGEDEVSGTFTNTGGTLRKKNSDVVLIIPPGAVGDGETVQIESKICARVAAIYSLTKISEKEYIASPLVSYKVKQKKACNFRKQTQVTLPICIPSGYDINEIKVYAFTTDKEKMKKCEIPRFSPEKGGSSSSNSTSFQATDMGITISAHYLSTYTCTYCGRVEGVPSLTVIATGRNRVTATARQTAEVTVHVSDSRLRWSDFQMGAGVKMEEKIAEKDIQLAVMDKEGRPPTKCLQDIVLYAQLELLDDDIGIERWQHRCRQRGGLAVDVVQRHPVCKLLSCDKETCKKRCTPNLTSPAKFQWLLETKVHDLTAVQTGGYDLSCVVDFCQITGTADRPVFKELRKRGGTVDTLPLEVPSQTGARRTERAQSSDEVEITGHQWKKEFITGKVFWELSKGLGTTWRQFISLLPGWKAMRPQEVIERVRQQEREAHNQIWSCLLAWAQECPSALTRSNILSTLAAVDMNQLKNDLDNIRPKEE